MIEAEPDSPFKPIADSDLDETALKVVNWRLEQLLNIGLDYDMAVTAAKSNIDLEEIRTLVEKKECSPELAVRILAPLAG